MVNSQNTRFGAGTVPAPKAEKPALSITKLVGLLRRTDEYKEWEKQVFLRDRFACQHCGKRNGRKRIIEAHHFSQLYPFGTSASNSER